MSMLARILLCLRQLPPSFPPLPSCLSLPQAAVAGIISQIATYPLDIIRRRVQVADLAGVSHASIAGTARRIFVEKGLRGSYVGLSVGYVKIAPMTAGADANHAIDLAGDNAGDQSQTASPRPKGLQRGLFKGGMRKSNMFRLYTIPTDNSGVQSR
ncbi:mitochondrial carrier protein [Apiospora sp. TS-2023a]